MDIKRFNQRLIKDLSKYFSDIIIEGNAIKIRQGATEINFEASTVFRDYQYSKNYHTVFDEYKNIIENALIQYKFSIDYSNIYPILKPSNFARKEDIGFYREPLALDLHLLYVTDCGETFRFLLNSDQADFEKVKEQAFCNLNKIANALVKLDHSLEVYSLKFTTDYAATLLLSTAIQMQIAKKIGTDFLFAVPSGSTLIVAKYSPIYVDILKKLMLVDNDPNKISARVYRVKNGEYSFADKNHLVIKKV